VRVLVTGHRGYIGTILVPMLADRGHDVVGLDTDLYRFSSFGEPPPEIPNLGMDIRDVALSDLQGFDAVLHLAGLSNDPLGDLDPALTYEINFHASVRLAKLAREAGVGRFVFSSSCSNYGAGGDDFLDESSLLNPVTPYGKSKVMVEWEVSALADEGFSPVFLRSATAFGVSPRLRFDLVLNNLVAWAFTTGVVRLKSDGMAWRPVVHIDDISRAFAAVLEAPRDLVHNRGFNVGRTTENYRVRDLAEIVRETVPGSSVELAPGAGADLRCYRVSCDRLPRTIPGFQPSWTARQGAQELYRAYADTGLVLEDFEGARYRRLQQLRLLMERGLLGRELRWVDAGTLPSSSTLLAGHSG
jgi:nucleoside-diphosphate-sugar epimerase